MKKKATKKRSKRPKTVQLTFRLPAAFLAEADGYTESLSIPGRKATRTDVIRVAIADGLAALKKEFG